MRGEEVKDTEEGRGGGPPSGLGYSSSLHSAAGLVASASFPSCWGCHHFNQNKQKASVHQAEAT